MKYWSVWPGFYTNSFIFTWYEPNGSHSLNPLGLKVFGSSTTMIKIAWKRQNSIGNFPAKNIRHFWATTVALHECPLGDLNIINSLRNNFSQITTNSSKVFIHFTWNFLLINNLSVVYSDSVNQITFTFLLITLFKTFHIFLRLSLLSSIFLCNNQTSIFSEYNWLCYINAGRLVEDTWSLFC